MTTAQTDLKGHRPLVLWFTGISGAGKTTIATIVARELLALRRHVVVLDGDALRLGLNRDLSFTDADRTENVRRVAEVAQILADAGLIVLVALISPLWAHRAMARERISTFVEVFVDTPLDVAETRDVKGLYKRARAGQLGHFTGVHQPYEPPDNPEIRIDTCALSAEAAAAQIVSFTMAKTSLG